MRLIDADALLERIMDINSWYLYNEWGSETEFHKLIDEAPTIEPTDTDLISRADAIKAVAEHFSFDDGCSNIYKDIDYYIGIAGHILKNVPSAAAEPKSEQYKKGFEDAKRALELEYARESENMRKRIAGLEVLLNAREAIAEANSVVWCKDCKHLKTMCEDEGTCYYWCKHWNNATDDWGHCYYGERREP